MTGPLAGPPAPFRIAFVPGVTPDKWLRIWARRLPGMSLEATQVPVGEQLTVLREGRADMCFVRLPVDRDGLHLIPLYHEVPVVVVPLDHPVAAYDEIALADLAGEHLLADQVSDERAVETVAAGEGLVILPSSVARLHRRKDVTHRPVTGVPGSQVGLAWPRDATDPRVETFIGIVRGRTERSSRGR